MTIKAVIFDLDGTLYDYDAAHAVAYDALCKYTSSLFGIGEDAFRRLYAEAERIMRERAGDTAATHSRTLRCQAILEQLGAPIRQAPKMSRLYWETLIDHMIVSPGAAECLDALRGMGLTLGVGTNMTPGPQFRKLERLGLIDRFDFLVTSEEAACEKPGAGLFMLCAKKAGAAAEACMYVGDSLGHDVRGAEACGMTGVLYRPHGDVPEGVKHAVRTLGELPGMLLNRRNVK